MVTKQYYYTNYNINSSTTLDNLEYYCVNFKIAIDILTCAESFLTSSTGDLKLCSKSY